MIDYIFDEKEILYYKDDATYKRLAEFFDTIKSTDDFDEYLNSHNYSDKANKIFKWLYILHLDEETWNRKIINTSKDTFDVKGSSIQEIVDIINSNPDKVRYLIDLNTFFEIDDISLLKSLPNREKVRVGSRSFNRSFSLDEYIDRIEKNSDLLIIYNRVKQTYGDMKGNKKYSNILALYYIFKNLKSEEEVKRFFNTFYDDEVFNIIFGYYKMYNYEKYNQKDKWSKYMFERATDVTKIDKPSSIEEIKEVLDHDENKIVLITLDKAIDGDWDSINKDGVSIKIGFDFKKYSKTFNLAEFIFFNSRCKRLYEEISKFDFNSLSYDEITTCEHVFNEIGDQKFLDVFFRLFFEDDSTREKIIRVYLDSKKEMSWDSMKLLKANDTFIIDGKEDIREIVNIIKQNPEHKNYYIKLENKTYDNQELLDKLDVKENVFIEYDSNNICCSVEEFLTMRAAIDYWKSVIRENNLSKLETIMYAYDLIKGFTFNDDDENIVYPRRIHKILTSDKIVCAGYICLIEQLLHELGIDAMEIHVRKESDSDYKHVRMGLMVKDPKYGLNEEELFSFDPTWDSNKKYLAPKDTKEERNPNEPEHEEEMIEKATGDTLYKHFLISLRRYAKKYSDEYVYDVSDIYWKNSIMNKDKIKETFNGENKTNINLTYAIFAALIYNVKRAEGYPKEMMADTLKKILKVNFNMNVDGNQVIEDLLNKKLIEQMPLEREVSMV